MSPKKQLFYPGQYLDWEKADVEQRQKIASGELKAPVPAFAMAAFGAPKPITEEEIIAYNSLWNPYDPLYNDPKYAREHGHKSVPAYPGFKAMAPMGMKGFPHDYSSEFYYTMDKNDFHYARNIYAGDLMTSANQKLRIVDITVPGATERVWELGGEGDTLDQNGQLILHANGNTLEAYATYTDGSGKMDFSENMASWTKYFPPAHYTTDEDYEYIRSLWAGEKINGDDVPCWEDVAVGFELPKTCSNGPVTYMDLIYYYGVGKNGVMSREALSNPTLAATTYRDAFGGYLGETALHFSGRNIPGFRGVFYNDMAAKLVARTLTNFVGTKGRVSRFGWGLFPFFKQLRVRPIDADMFNKVPGMEGRDCDRHGSEGDTVIGRAVITGKFINDAGEHCCEVALWAETLDGDIIASCPSEIVLPSRK